MRAFQGRRCTQMEARNNQFCNVDFDASDFTVFFQLDYELTDFLHSDFQLCLPFFEIIIVTARIEFNFFALRVFSVGTRTVLVLNAKNYVPVLRQLTTVNRMHRSLTTKPMRKYDRNQFSFEFMRTIVDGFHFFGWFFWRWRRLLLKIKSLFRTLRLTFLKPLPDSHFSLLLFLSEKVIRSKIFGILKFFINQFREWVIDYDVVRPTFGPNLLDADLIFTKHLLTAIINGPLTVFPKQIQT